MEKKVIVAVDFDGVLHKYSKGWHNGKIYDEPFENAALAMGIMLDKGFEVVIFSTRSYDRKQDGVIEKGQIKEMKDWLDRNNIPYSRIATEPKPYAQVYLDDRALRFEGNWMDSLRQIMVLYRKGQLKF